MKPFRNKVLRCVCQYDGPVVPVREIYRHIKKAVCNDVKSKLSVIFAFGKKYQFLFFTVIHHVSNRDHCESNFSEGT